jgi:hypothetical protein
MNVEIPATIIPQGSAVSFKIEITTQFNISAAVAKQKVNRFLAMNAGNMLAAGDPELVVGTALVWRVPVLFGTPAKGALGRVGELAVDADTGEVQLERSSDLEEMQHHAEILYSSASSPAGA